MRERFWELPLEDLDEDEWEALCDGCGRCCLVKLQDEDSGEVAFTDVACAYLDQADCRCTVYPERQRYVPDCMPVTPGGAAFWLAARHLRLPAPRQRSAVGRLASVDFRSRRVGARGGHQRDRPGGVRAGVAEDDLEEHIVHWVG